jgi:hypothetical protein
MCVSITSVPSPSSLPHTINHNMGGCLLQPFSHLTNLCARASISASVTRMSPLGSSTIMSHALPTPAPRASVKARSSSWGDARVLHAGLHGSPCLYAQRLLGRAGPLSRPRVTAVSSACRGRHYASLRAMPPPSHVPARARCNRRARQARVCGAVGQGRTDSRVRRRAGGACGAGP